MTREEALMRIKTDNFNNGYGLDMQLMVDSIGIMMELLKDQEAVKPYIDYDGQDVWRCGRCGNSLMHPSYYESDEDAKNYIRYCSHCGRPVKWE